MIGAALQTRQVSRSTSTGAKCGAVIRPTRSRPQPGKAGVEGLERELLAGHVVDAQPAGDEREVVARGPPLEALPLALDDVGVAGADDLQGDRQRLDQPAQGGDDLLAGVVDLELGLRGARASTSSGRVTANGIGGEDVPWLTVSTASEEKRKGASRSGCSRVTSTSQALATCSAASSSAAVATARVTSSTSGGALRAPGDGGGGNRQRRGDELAGGAGDARPRPWPATGSPGRRRRRPRRWARRCRRWPRRRPGWRRGPGVVSWPKSMIW